MLYPKAVAGSGRSLLHKLPGVRGGERELPDLELALNDVGIDRRHLIDYQTCAGSSCATSCRPHTRT